MPQQESNLSTASLVPEFRPELAFPPLTEEMVERLRPYGQEEIVAADQCLFSRGQRQVDMLVVLDGELIISVPAQDGEPKVIARHRKFEFSGELNLLNSQGSLVEARTAVKSRLLRISRNELQRL